LAVSEALTFAKRSGLDLERTLAAVAAGAAGGWGRSHPGAEEVAGGLPPRLLIRPPPQGPAAGAGGGGGGGRGPPPGPPGGGVVRRGRRACAPPRPRWCASCSPGPRPRAWGARARRRCSRWSRSRSSAVAVRAHAADGGVEHLDRVRHWKRLAALAQEHLDLQRAPGVGGDEELGGRGEHVVHLALAHLPRALRLDQVVDAGAAAALIALGDLAQLEPGDRGEERARLGAHALRVRQVACVVVGDLDLDRVARRHRLERGKVLVDVAHL